MKDAIAAGELDPNDLESIKKTPCFSTSCNSSGALPLPETSSSLGSVELDEVDELERERTVYQNKRLMSIEKARAFRGVGETSHDQYC